MTDDTTDDLLTTNAAAVLLGLSMQRVRMLARSRGLGRKLGGTRIFTPDEVDCMRDRKSGRPYPPHTPPES